MDYVTLIGSIAGVLTTISLLPQVIKTWKEKSAKDLSLTNYLMLCSGMILWLIYGLLKRDTALIAANSVSILFSSTLIIFKLRYG